MKKAQKQSSLKNPSQPSYDPSLIEKKWQKYWEDNKVFSPDMEKAPRPIRSAQGKPFYNLMMFPYPSAEGMHVGNMYAFTGADVYGRFMRMQGYDVFEPIGLDGFGIHSENYAFKTGRHPMEQAEVSEKNFYRQLRATGNSYDWTRTVETYKPNYYHWTQWLFVQMFKAGLAYRKKAEVNWCPSCKTVLADEQVIDGKCERCGSVVEQRQLEQWFFRITEYAERLLNNIEKLDWTEKVKIAQRNWIGKSEGAKIDFKIVLDSSDLTPDSLEQYSSSEVEKYVEVFTTRPDTLYGATFLVLSPEHHLAQTIEDSKVRKYIAEAKKKDDKTRTAEDKEKTGVFTGLYAINPVTKESIPVWIADYVLMGYGTGAIMGVPAHDERDYVFAKKYTLPVRPVIIRKSDVARSYVMGGDTITHQDLTNLGIKIVGKGKEGRYIEIPFDALDQYEKLIKEKLQSGFWNEYIGQRGVVFIFKFKDGTIKRMVLNEKTEKEIDQLAAEFNNQEVPEKTNVWGWLSENEFYHDFLIHDEPGVVVNSGNAWEDYCVPDAIPRMIVDLEKWGIGKRKVQYHLRDWLISRQRYWGPPIPMVFCENCAKMGKSWFTENKVARVSREEKNKARGTRDTLDTRDTFWSLGWYPVSDDQLPVKLPRIDDYKPLGSGTSPLGSHPEFYKTTCPSCGGEARRETDVSDTFLDSSWYFFRYLATEFDTIPFPSDSFIKNPKFEARNSKQYQNSNVQNSKKFRISDFDIRACAQRAKWLPVDMYIGGAEHSVLHLLYSRFITMVLADLKYISFDEPYKRFFAHGLLVKEGAKMSKSKGNVVIPDEYIKKFGADTVRCYLMFLGPFNHGGDFYDSGIEGTNRFLKRVWRLIAEQRKNKTQNSAEDSVVSRSIPRGSAQIMHKTIKKVTEDIQGLRYNTALAAMMEWYNYLSGKGKGESGKLTTVEAETFLKLLAPFAPHMTEELWERVARVPQVSRVSRAFVHPHPRFHAPALRLSSRRAPDVRSLEGEGRGEGTRDTFQSIHLSPWPTFDPTMLVEEVVKIVVQVNGKVRDIIEIESGKLNPPAGGEKEVEELARASEKVQKHLEGKNVKDVIYVEGKIINFVVND